MKVLVFGARGWIGNQFTSLLTSSNVEFIDATSRADNYEACTEEITSSGATHVVSLIGRTHGTGFSTIDYLEQEGKLMDNMRDNLYSPLVLARICSSFGIHFTYLGTGCIFEYDGEHTPTNDGFTEGSRPNFFGSSYSIVKGYTDRLFSLLFPTALNLRIRMPITACKSKRNFITKITSYEKICSNPNSMSVLPTLLPVMLNLMRRESSGCLNFCNPGVISHNEILKMYKEIVDPSFTWKNFTDAEQNEVLAAKRSNNKLDTTLLESIAKVPDIRSAVRSVILQMAQK